jgi:hypothetical protein
MSDLDKSPIDNALAGLEDEIAALESARGGEIETEFYTRILKECAAETTAVQAEYEFLAKAAALVRDRRLSILAKRVKGLEFRYGAIVQAEVAKAIEGKKSAKYVDTAAGRLGYKNQPNSESVIVDNEQAAITFCQLVQPSAVKLSLSTSEVKRLLKNGETIEGVHLEVTEKPARFYTDFDAALKVLPTSILVCT